MPKSSQSKRKVSVVETLALCFLGSVLAVIATSTLMRHRFEQYVVANEPLKHELRDRYGPEQFSQFGEEWIIRDHFQDRRGGIFLDVGSSHYKEFNNTYYLETVLGWSGIAVDALQEFAKGYETNRPKTKFVAMFASDTTDAKVQLFVPEQHQLSSSDPNFTKKYGEQGTARAVPTTTLDALLDQGGIQRLDFLSMDIELAEPKALAGFDIDRFRPELVCIEAHPEVRQQILEYFAAHGYVLVGKYLRVDPHNLYFQPFDVPNAPR
jgi:FkbM family methyltransferase